MVIYATIQFCITNIRRLRSLVNAIMVNIIIVTTHHTYPNSNFLYIKQWWFWSHKCGKNNDKPNIILFWIFDAVDCIPTISRIELWTLSFPVVNIVICAHYLNWSPVGIFLCQFINFKINLKTLDFQIKIKQKYHFFDLLVYYLFPTCNTLVKIRISSSLWAKDKILGF